MSADILDLSGADELLCRRNDPPGDASSVVISHR